LIIQQYDKWFEYIQKRNGDPTGRVTPENIIPELWRSYERDTSGFSSVVGARGIAHSPFDAAAEGPEEARIVEITTPEGIVVTWHNNTDVRVEAGLQASGRSRVRQGSEKSGRGGGAVNACETQLGRLREFAKSNRVF
jgi:hypothetical protein